MARSQGVAMFERGLILMLVLGACSHDERTDDGYACEADVDFVAEHNRCTSDSDCVIVGGCSGEWGFRAVSSSAQEEARARSRATECRVFDGPIYSTACRDNRCALLPTGAYCGAPPIDAGRDAARTDADLPDATQADANFSSLDATSP
jgi:hypothetical protein